MDIISKWVTQLTNHCKLRNITNTIALQTISQGPNEKFKDVSRTNTQGQGRGQGQIFEDKDEDEDKILASRSTCPRGLNIIALLHSYMQLICELETIITLHQMLRQEALMYCTSNYLN